MAKKWVQFDGKKWVVVGSEGGGGTGHTHPNLTLLNSITQAMVTSWNTAATWVATNGANILAHIANSLLHLPSGGTAGQVLQKTASGSEWKGLQEEYSLIERIELTEDVTSLFRNAEPDNTPYNFKRIVVTVEIPATASKTTYTLMQFRGRTIGNVERGVNVYCAANSSAARKQCLAMADCGSLLFLPVGYGYSNGGYVAQQCYAMNDISYYININRITYINISNGLPAGAIIKIYGVRIEQ